MRDSDPVARATTIRRYGMAILAVIVASVVRASLDRILGSDSPFLTSSLALLVAARFGGLGPGMLALALCLLTNPYFFLEPRYSLAIASWSDRAQFLLFFIVGFSIVLLSGSTQKALRLLRAAESGEKTWRQDLETLLEAMPAPVWIGHDPACHRITGNRAASEVIGLPVEVNVSPTPASGEPTPFTVFTQGSLAVSQDLPMQRAARTGVATPSEELEIRRPDGSVRFLYGSAVPLWNGDGKVRGCIGAFVDITQRKQIELALRESQDHFRITLNTISQLAWTAHPDGFIFWYNQRWYEYTGTTPQQMEGWGWQSVHNPATLPSVMEAWKNSIANGQLFDMEIQLRAADGQFRTFLTRAHPLKNFEGQVTQWFGTNTDITERRQAERQIQQSNQELEQRVAVRTADLLNANKELEAFAYSVSHDLRAPIRHISGFTEALRKSNYALLDPTGQRQLDKITTAAKNMGRLIDDLLAFSRLRRAEVSTTLVNLQQLQEEVHLDMEPDTAGRNIVWLIGELPQVYGDRAMLRQVFVNLLSNAVKYTRDRSEARIEIGCLPSSPEQITIFVRDNGVGFDMQYVDKLFNVFQRLHSEDFEGTGIGLANVRRIVERHGGRVWAEAALDKGAVFYFSLANTPSPE